jgi:hypothetical protein
MELLNKKLGRTHKVGVSLYKEPFSEMQYYSHDIEGAFRMGGTGKDPLTCHLEQDIDWSSKEVVKYKFNSMGLRGPEPDYNAKKKILFVGGSLMHGVGVNEEDSFPYKLAKEMDASYINVSDTDTLTELFDEIDDHVTEFEPDYLILGDTRFFDEFGYAWTMFWKNKDKTKEERQILLNDLRPILVKRNQKVMELLLYKINNLYNIPSVFITSMRKDFAFVDIKSYGTKMFYLDNSYFVDLGRDNRHGGPATHDNITLRLLNLLKP